MTDVSDPTHSSSVDAGDRLPPVEPPTGSFIVQLFLIPMLIVGIVVLVWLLFSWLAHMDNRPEELVADLERMNHASWQQALTLANNLNDPRHKAIRRDPLFAQRLASVLQHHLDEGGLDDESIDLRVYLCHALGNFEVSAAIPALLSAATTERDNSEIVVRRSAVWAIGQVARHIGAEALTDPEVFKAIKEASTEFGEGEEMRPRGRLRSTAAVVLGKLDTPAATQRLTEMLSDPYPDTRYNAAVALASLGNPAATEMFLEMLDPANQEVVKYETQQKQIQSDPEPDTHTWKRHDVILQTLFAIKDLAAKNADADLSGLITAIRDLEGSDLPKKIKIEAKDVMRILEERRSASVN